MQAKPLAVIVALLVTATVAGCATTQQSAAVPAAETKTADTKAAESPMAKEYFVVLPEDERMYVFGDAKTYLSFLQHGEVALTRTRIGASPMGTTVVFGILNDDVKSGKPSLGEQVFDGKLKPAEDFYGEVQKDGRYYVFGNHKDMDEFIRFGEVAYGFTDIGVGPGGSSVVWVMNKDSIKAGRPTARIAKFSAIRTGSSH
jgi:hypothetical protein